MKKVLLIVGLLCMSTLIYAQFNPDSGLVVFYHFQNNTTDASGNAYDATNYGCTFVTGHIGDPNSAAYFNGGAYLQLPLAARFQPLSSHTVALWLKTSQTSRFDLIDQRTGSGNPSADNFSVIFNIPGVDDHYSAPHYNPNANDTWLHIFPPNVDNGEWHHLAFVKNCDNDTMYFYYDGVELNKKYFEDVTYSIGGNLLVGTEYSHTVFLTGTIDEFRINNRALSPAEITSVYLGVIENIDFANSFNLYPVPATDKITIERISFNANKETVLSVFNIKGQLILKQFLQKDKTEINISSFDKGVYIVNVRGDDMNLTKKVIKE